MKNNNEENKYWRRNDERLIRGPNGESIPGSPDPSTAGEEVNSAERLSDLLVNDAAAGGFTPPRPSRRPPSGEPTSGPRTLTVSMSTRAPPIPPMLAHIPDEVQVLVGELERPGLAIVDTACQQTMNEGSLGHQGRVAVRGSGNC